MNAFITRSAFPVCADSSVMTSTRPRRPSSVSAGEKATTDSILELLTVLGSAAMSTKLWFTLWMSFSTADAESGTWTSSDIRIGRFVNESLSPGPSVLLKLERLVRMGELTRELNMEVGWHEPSSDAASSLRISPSSVYTSARAQIPPRFMLLGSRECWAPPELTGNASNSSTWFDSSSLLVEQHSPISN